MSDLVGKKLKDFYILRRLGRGAMADVYLAQQLSLNRQVAFKVLNEELARDPNYVRRFQHEARAAAALVHAGIVQIYEVGEEHGVAVPAIYDHQPAELTELNLREAGISTVIWATGYGLDYDWIAAPILDELGYPRNERGVAAVPGLYFLGLLWQHKQASASLVGPSLDGPYLVDRMAREAAPRSRVGRWLYAA